MRIKAWCWAAVLVVAFSLLWQVYPSLLFKVSEWQRSFNLSLSAALNSLQEHRLQAGWGLMSVSFLYGVFHAVGPGHGKFILGSYLSFEQTKLPKAIKLTLLSALVQGLVAIGLVSVIVVLFSLSRSQFNLTLKWVERGSFMIMMLLGIYWIYQTRGLFSRREKQKKKPTILQITPINQPLVSRMPIYHKQSVTCGCGHKHLPSNETLNQATDWKSQWMLVLGIGLRPCTGAILVLFLAYMLDLYLWGVLATLVMALGTGLSLTMFALLVLFARKKALKIGKWYFSVSHYQMFGKYLKWVLGIVMILLAFILLQSSWLENSHNRLFKR